MATKFYKFTGIGEWFKIFVPDDYNGVKRYTLNFYPDDRQAIIDSGLQLRYDRKTNSFIRPKRDVEKRIKDEIVQFGPPEIVNFANEKWESREMGLIGNGTKVELTIAIFDTKMGKGHRLEKVRVLDLKTYEKPETEGQKEEKKTEPSVKKSGNPF